MAKRIVSVAALWLLLLALVFLYTDRSEYTWTFEGEELARVLMDTRQAQEREDAAQQAMALEREKARERAGMWSPQEQYGGAPQTREAVDGTIGLNLMWGTYEVTVSYASPRALSLRTVSALRQPFIEDGDKTLPAMDGAMRFSFTLTDACEAMCAAAPALRLHLGSLEPRCLTEEAVERMKKLNICPHFHLSLQSGCDATLKRMNRKYDTALFYAVVERLRAAFPGCAITTDLICGFPGETEEEFEETLAFIRRCDFSAMHVFPYSVRPGTPAAKMEQLPQKVKTERAARAIAAAEEMELAYLRAQLGRTLTVIFETERNGASRGHSENYVEVSVAESGLRGLVRNVKITGLDGKMLVGSVL